MRSMRRGTRLGVVVAVALALACANAVAVFKAGAVPRYSARYEQKCGLCHLNPTGGGMRTAYASQKLVPEEIAWSKAKPEILAGIEPRISKHVLIGTDFRELYLGSDAPLPQRDFFQMQGDVYLDIELDPKVSLYFARHATDTRERLGLGYVTFRILTWIGQADLLRRDPQGGPVTRGFVTSHELTLGLHQGLDLKGTYDFYDPDKQHATGAKTRWGGGLFVMPQSYLALEFLERRTTFEDGIAYSGDDFYESVFQLHLLY